MKAEVLLGLAKLLEKKAKDVRDTVQAGDYDLDADVHLHVSGTLEVGEDDEYTPTVQIPWKTTLAFFLHHAGITREAAMGKLVLAMQEALKTGNDAGELVSTFADLEEAEALVQEGLDELPKKPRRGKVVVEDLEVNEIKRTRAA